MNKWLLVIIIGLGIVLAGLLYKLYKPENNATSVPVVSTVEEARIETYDVKKIRTVSGHEFSLMLADGRMVRAFLGTSSTPEAKPEVVRWINKAKRCQVVIRHTSDSVSADLLLTQNGEDVSLTDWLYANNLAWDNQCQPPSITWE